MRDQMSVHFSCCVPIYVVDVALTNRFCVRIGQTSATTRGQRQ